jgi:hypothetical protein
MTIVFGHTDGSRPTASILSKEPTTHSRMGKYQLVINLKTAKVLGPPTLLARADEVIE